jgi:hypothetical protein
MVEFYRKNLGLVFVPPAGTANVLNYEGNLIGQAVVILALGGGLYWRSQAAQGLTRR